MLKLSIITINYNNLEGLKSTYESVVSQTWKGYEWILIDGGSSDGSREFIEEHQDKFAYWCSEPDKGVYNAMNKGIEKAHGAYLNFMNSGDAYYEPKTLMNVFGYHFSEDVLYGNELQLDGRLCIEDKLPSSLTLHFLLNKSIRHQSTFIKRELFSEKRYNESLRFVADWQRFIEFHLEGRTFRHLNFFVARFNLLGISSNHNLVEQEKIDALTEVFSKKYMPLVMESRTIQQKLNRIHADELIDNPYLIQVSEILKCGGFTASVLKLFLKVQASYNKLKNKI